MFTGIVEEVGTVVRVDDRGGDVRLRIEAGVVPSDVAIGDSVSVSGCCLTAVAVDAGGFEVELSRETVAKTAPRWTEGARVNLERALRLGGRLGGHLVSGHVEGVGTVIDVHREPGAFVITMRAPERLARYLIPKGSVTVDGVSLTVVDLGGPAGSTEALDACTFTLWLIPHTLDVTTLGELASGSKANLETDMFAKYAERLAGMAGHAAEPAATHLQEGHQP